MTSEDRGRILGLKAEHVLAITLWGEARGEPIEGKIAVAHVINNRAIDKRWPNTIVEVCIQPMQFSCWNENDPNYPEMIRKTKRGINYEIDPIWRECVFAAHGVVNKWVRDNTKGANHYNTIKVDPKWDDNMILTATIGNHEFFKG